jgi:hypothetical protein
VVGAGRAAAGATKIALTRDGAAVAVGGQAIEIFDATKRDSQALHIIRNPHTSEPLCICARVCMCVYV